MKTDLKSVTWKPLGVSSCVLLLVAACSSAPTTSDTDDTTPVVVATDTTNGAEPDATQDTSQDIEYNLARLSDPDYTQTYGDGENEKIWYSAAENLGMIGKPAIPHLIEKLASDDDFEVMLALYALQLASQDQVLQAQTDGNYLTLPSVLNPRANRHNRAIALDWWQTYQHLWD